jgi:phenylacetate-CoA ligase
MSQKFFDKDRECIPLKGLVELQQANLRAAEIVKYASTSALYKDSWQKAGFAPVPINDRRQLKQFPYINSASIKQAYAQHEIYDVVNMRHARLWCCTSGTTGAGKWIPYSDTDIEMFMEMLMRNFYQYGSPYRVLSFTSPAPFVGDMLANLGIFAQARYSFHQELIPIGFSASPEVINLARKRRADVLLAFPSVAMRAAEELVKRVKPEIERMWHETKSLKFWLIGLLFKIRKPSARDIFKFRYGLFNGEAVDPYRNALQKNYGLEPFDTYALTEFPCLNMDCAIHDGVHIWSDCCVPEIIPENELEKEENIPGYVPQALFLDEASAGMKGEYVVTTFNRALPLVRYRTSDLIQVSSTTQCSCERTHPRVKFLRRLDDIINMGIIRFSVQEFESILKQVQKYGSIEQWQVCMTRQDYKPLLKLMVTGVNISDSKLFIDDIRQNIFKIRILQTGAEGGLVCQPEISIEDKIDIITTVTGKLRRVIYAKDW